VQVSDTTLTSVLCRYAGLVQVVLDDPERWLGFDDRNAATQLVGRATLGSTPPASPRWPQLSDAERSQWWVTRIGVVAGLAAAAPRYAGALADRFPLQAGLGAAAAGLAVCAVAREHGRGTPEEWVPLLGTVLFDRNLSLPSPGSSAAAAAEPEPEPGGEADTETPHTAAGPVKTLWRLARTFFAIQSLFDERPRGNIVARGIAKVPVVGVAGGWFDERGAIRKAGERTAELVATA
jgi:hypothetical protein